ncbi:MAG TPA: hypothetical protein PLS81_00665 [Deltaproteobacteria bacterium]|nr:hypothetical protein [Deltaproteobacteria bacterium]HPP80790.1 hypothetical protein [Deltaproteobacteria bacterium]
MSSLSVFLALILAFLEGCSALQSYMSIGEAEASLSQGKAPKQDLRELEKQATADVLARIRIAMIVESAVKGEVNYASAKAELKDIRDKAELPSYLRVEAGYLLVLVERMETLAKASSRARDLARENEELKKALDSSRKELEDLGKENEELRFKLKKLEEIHMESLRRRGAK